MLRKRLAAFATAIALCLTGAALVPASSMALDPILFVHGWNGSASNWNTMKGRFEKDGYPASHLSTYTYNSSTSNKTLAETEVKSRVESLLKADRRDQGRHHRPLDGQPQHPLVHQVRRRW